MRVEKSVPFDWQRERERELVETLCVCVFEIRTVRGGGDREWEYIKSKRKEGNLRWPQSQVKIRAVGVGGVHL
jgi:hypothetical protein